MMLGKYIKSDSYDLIFDKNKNFDNLITEFIDQLENEFNEFTNRLKNEKKEWEEHEKTTKQLNEKALKIIILNLRN